MDATHPQHNSVLAGGWIKRGEEQGIPTNTGRRRLNINGAIDLERLEPVVRCDDTINADSVIALFEQLVAFHPMAVEGPLSSWIAWTGGRYSSVISGTFGIRGNPGCPPAQGCWRECASCKLAQISIEFSLLLEEQILLLILPWGAYNVAFLAVLNTLTGKPKGLVTSVTGPLFFAGSSRDLRSSGTDAERLRDG